MGVGDGTSWQTRYLLDGSSVNVEGVVGGETACGNYWG